MTVVCGIYGYQITRPIDLLGLRIEPRTSDYQECKRLASDLNSYHLTAVLKGNSISDDLLFNLEAVLSFVEHLDVLISSPEEQVNDDVFAQIPQKITTHKRKSGGGPAIIEDSFVPTSRSTFISKAISKLQNKQYCEQSKFNILFFKYVETFRSQRSFADISYFLLYSGLESFARSVLHDQTRGPSKPICELLTGYQFDVQIERPMDLKRAVSTYTHLRNALFHNSQLQTTVNINGATVKLKLSDYFFNLSQLIALVILKAVTFDDGHINWDSWIDRQPFK